MKTIAALSSALLFFISSLHAADVRQPAKAGPAAPPKPVAAPTPIKPPGMPPSNPAPARDAIKLVLPDLIVHQPVVYAIVVHGKRHYMGWTIKNIGDADAHSTTLLVKCEVVYSVLPTTTCEVKKVSIPPIGKGASYTHEMDPAFMMHDQAAAKPYRLKFFAEIDPDHQVTEKNESNNTVAYTHENYTGAMPPMDPNPVGVVPQPKLTLKTEDAWNPDQPNWVVVRNDSMADAPAVKVQVTCRHTGSHDPCSFLPDSTKPIQPLAKGHIAPVLQYLPPIYKGYVYKITFHLQGIHGESVNGADLVLSKP